MNDKLYRIVSAVGIWNLVLGIVTLITGVTSGVLLLVNAARLLKSRKEIVF